MAVRELTVFSPVISVFSTGEEGIEALPNEILILIAKQFADAHSRETAETLRTLCNMRLVNCRWARVLSVDLVARLAIEAKGLPHCRNPLELIPGPPPNLFEELVRDFYHLAP